MSGESVRFEDILTQLEEKRQALEKREQEADRLLHQREEDARKAREFRDQMERAKDNARGRGEAEAKRILRDARAAADQVFQELSEMRKAQARADRALNENEARAALRRDAERGGGGRVQARRPAGAHSQAQPAHPGRRPGGVPRRPPAGGGGVRGQGRNPPAEGRYFEDEGQGG